MPSSFKLGGYTLNVLGSSKLLRTGRIASRFKISLFTEIKSCTVNVNLVLIHDFIISDCFCYYSISAFEATKII